MAFYPKLFFKELKTLNVRAVYKQPAHPAVCFLPSIVSALHSGCAALTSSANTGLSPLPQQLCVNIEVLINFIDIEDSVSCDI
jgi:hypothetical protein